MTTRPVPPGVSERTTAWRGHSGRWLFGYATSLTGDEVFYVALTWAAVQITTPAVVSLLLLANAVPRAVMLLVGGTLVDRVGPKRLVIGSDVARTVVMVCAAAAVLHQSATLPVLTLIAVLFGVVDGFFLPAAGSMPAYIAPPQALTQLQALRTVAVRASIFIGAPLGSWLVSRHSVSTAFFANAVLFALSVAALSLTRLVVSGRPAGTPRQGEPKEGGSPARAWLRQVASGLVEATKSRILRTLLIVIALLELGFTGPFTAGVPILVKSTGWGVAGVGWILGAFGVGAAATAGVLFVTGSALRKGTTMGCALAAMGLGLAAIGLATEVIRDPSLVLAAGSGLICGFGAGFFGTLSNTALVKFAPPGHVGRIMAVGTLVSFTSMPVSIAASGLLAQFLGASSPFVLGGAVIVLGGIVLLASTPLRSLRL